MTDILHPALADALRPLTSPGDGRLIAPSEVVVLIHNSTMVSVEIVSRIAQDGTSEGSVETISGAVIPQRSSKLLIVSAFRARTFLSRLSQSGREKSAWSTLDRTDEALTRHFISVGSPVQTYSARYEAIFRQEENTRYVFAVGTIERVQTDADGETYGVMMTTGYRSIALAPRTVI